jgi:hypothetical protein
MSGYCPEGDLHCEYMITISDRPALLRQMHNA